MFCSYVLTEDCDWSNAMWTMLLSEHKVHMTGEGSIAYYVPWYASFNDKTWVDMGASHRHP